MFKLSAKTLSLKGKLKRFASNFDQFAKQPNFSILGQEKYHTIGGFMTTILLMTICLVYLVSELNNLFQFSSPSVLISEELIKNSDQINLISNNFTMAVVLFDFNYVAMDNYQKYFSISLQNCHRTRKVNETSGKAQIKMECISYQLQNCTSNGHFNSKEQRQFFQNYNLTNMLCPNLDQWNQRPLKLQGQGYGENFQYIILNIDKCKNSTDPTKQICESEENIQSKLSTGLYSLYLNDALIKMEQTGNPYQDSIESQIDMFSLYDSKVIIQSYRNIETYTDTGLLYQNQHLDSKIILGNRQITQQYYNQHFLIQHVIQLDSKMNIYKRSYVKVQSILGTMGGLWNFFSCVFTLVLSQITVKLMNIQVAEQLFKFEDKIDQNNQEFPDNVQQNSDNQGDQTKKQIEMNHSGHQDSLKGKSDSVLKRRKSVFSSERQIFDINTNQDLQLFLKQRKKSLNLGKLEYLKLFLGCNKLLWKQLDYASNKITSKMDIAFLLKKMLEIDKLKQILLTEDQLNLFEYIPKPVIPQEIFENQFQNKINQLELLKPYKFVFGEEQSDSLKIQLAYSSYMNIQKQPRKSIQDHQLLSQLDENIINLFHKLSSNQTKINQLFRLNEYQQVLQFSQRLDPESADREIIQIE